MRQRRRVTKRKNTGLLWRPGEEEGAGETYVEEHLKGQVEHRTQERKDLWEVWAALPADALRNMQRQIWRRSRDQFEVLLLRRSGTRSVLHVGWCSSVWRRTQQDGDRGHLHVVLREHAGFRCRCTSWMWVVLSLSQGATSFCQWMGFRIRVCGSAKQVSKTQGKQHMKNPGIWESMSNLVFLRIKESRNFGSLKKSSNPIVQESSTNPWISESWINVVIHESRNLWIILEFTNSRFQESRNNPRRIQTSRNPMKNQRFHRNPQ